MFDVTPTGRLSKASFIKDNAVKEAMLETERKSSRKRQVVSFPLLPGRSVSSPGKGRLLFIAGSWRFGLAAERGVSA